MSESDGLHLGRGTRVARYEVVEVLGAGGFGITYKVVDTRLQCEVAMKEYLPAEYALRSSDHTTVLPRSEALADEYQHGLTRFLDEARVLAKFKNRHIVRVSDYMEVNGTAYLVMDYEEGQSLRSLIKERGGTLSEAEIKNIFIPILDGLKVVHDAGLLHRDIKPDNIYLRREGPPVLLDFGAARQYTASQTKSVTAIVTPGYAPFEQYQQNPDLGAWTDLYAIGATMYACIAGAPPLDAITRHAGSKVDPLPPAVEVGGDRYSEILLRSVDWMLRPAIRERPQSVDEVLPCIHGRAEPPEFVLASATVPATVVAPTVRAPATGTAGGDAATVMSTPTERGTEIVAPARAGSGGRVGLISGIVAAAAIGAGGFWWYSQDQGTGEPVAQTQQQGGVEQPAAPAEQTETEVAATAEPASGAAATATGQATTGEPDATQSGGQSAASQTAETTPFAPSAAETTDAAPAADTTTDEAAARAPDTEAAGTQTATTDSAVAGTTPGDTTSVEPATEETAPSGAEPAADEAPAAEVAGTTETETTTAEPAATTATTGAEPAATTTTAAAGETPAVEEPASEAPAAESAATAEPAAAETTAADTAAAETLTGGEATTGGTSMIESAETAAAEPAAPAGGTTAAESAAAESAAAESAAAESAAAESAAAESAAAESAAAESAASESAASEPAVTEPTVAATTPAETAVVEGAATEQASGAPRADAGTTDGVADQSGAQAPAAGEAETAAARQEAGTGTGADKVTENVDEFLTALMLESSQSEPGGNGAGAAEQGTGAAGQAPGNLDALLEQADAYLAASNLISPEGNNARTIYERVLALDADNPRAVAGMNKIGDVYERAAGVMLAEGRPSMGLQIVSRGLEAVPGHAGLLRVKSRLESQ